MEYAPEFYIRENIIGYTGNLHNNPTVHFKKGSAFGYILQRSLLNSVAPAYCSSGRSIVMKDSSHETMNPECPDGTTRYMEFLGGQRTSIFISSFQEVNAFNIDKLALAIKNKKYLRKPFVMPSTVLKRDWA